MISSTISPVAVGISNCGFQSVTSYSVSHFQSGNRATMMGI